MNEQISSSDIDAVCGLVDELCGIYWDESKAYLIEARLKDLAKQHNCENYADLVRKVRAEVAPGLKEQIIDAATTNETLWFRDGSPFEAMKYKLIPETIDQKESSAFPRRIRIWSAACSTGQEVYSIAMTLAETIPDYLDWDIQILGTDISNAAIEQASRGQYNKVEMGRGLSPELLARYFCEKEGAWSICEEIRSICTFQQRNLKDSFADLGAFDFVFCRNVAIYFTEDDRRALFERLTSNLTPQGWLFVGSSECLANLGPRWQPQLHCRANCYRPNLIQGAPA